MRKRVTELNALVERGICSYCKKQREPEARHQRHCLSCQVRGEERREKAFQFCVHAGTRPCRVCGRFFFSRDRREETSCEPCRENLFTKADGYAGVEWLPL